MINFIKSIFLKLSIRNLILFSIFIGVFFSVGQIMGLNLGEFASQNKIRFSIMLVYYSTVFLHFYLLVYLNIIKNKNGKIWFFFMGYITFFSLLLCALGIKEVILFLWISKGFIFFIFLHQKKFSEKKVFQFIINFLIFKIIYHCYYFFKICVWNTLYNVVTTYLEKE